MTVLAHVDTAGLSAHFPSMNPFTKTWFGLGLVLLALFEFCTAMRIWGSTKSTPWARLMIRLHRIGGYLFIVWIVFLMWVGLNMYERLSQISGFELSPRTFFHAFLAMTALVVVLLKISFIRFYRKYRPYVPLLGIVLTGLTVVLWGVAGLMFLYFMGGKQPG